MPKKLSNKPPSTKLVYQTHPVIMALAIILSILSTFVVLRQQTIMDHFLLQERIATVSRTRMPVYCATPAATSTTTPSTPVKNTKNY